DGTGAKAGGRNAVDARHQRDALGERHERDGVGADIAEVRAAQRQEMSLGVERELGADEEVAPLEVAEEGFVPLAGPLDRTADAPRGPGHQRELRIERVAGAEV